MTQLRLRNLTVSLVVLALLGGTGCDSGTNTGNGSPGCPAHICDGPVTVVGPDGKTYRGSVYAGVTIASDPIAQAESNPPVAELSFTGGEVELSDAGCRVIDSWTPYDTVLIFISANDASLDATGALHVLGAPRDGYFASGPILMSTPGGWARDLTLTSDGYLTATLSKVFMSGGGGGGGGGVGVAGDGGIARACGGGAGIACGGGVGVAGGGGGETSGTGGDASGMSGVGAMSGEGGAGGAGTSGEGGASGTGISGDGAAGSASEAGGVGGNGAPNGGNVTQQITITGPVVSDCGNSIPVRGGGTFNLPCRPVTNCDVSGG